jgi:hypothetical protein
VEKIVSSLRRWKEEHQRSLGLANWEPGDGLSWVGLRLDSVARLACFPSFCCIRTATTRFDTNLSSASERSRITTVIRRRVSVLTLSNRLWLIIAGVAILTFGFFASHSIASSWVGAGARQAKAQASSLYLLAYYLGSSIAGSAINKNLRAELTGAWKLV